MRRSLSLLLIAGLLPVVALGGTFGAITLRNDRRAIAQQAQADASFAAAVLAVKLRSDVQAVDMVTQSPAFDGAKPDLDRFRTLASRIIASQRDWRTISVANAQGQRLVDVPEPIGGVQQGPVVELASLRRVVATGTAQIGDMVTGPKGGRAFAVRAPVIKGGVTRYVVSVIVPAASLRGLLLFGGLPNGWTASAIDAAGQAVTASAGAQPARPAPSASVKSWARVGDTGWRVRVTTPAAAYARPFWNAVLLLAVAALLCLLLLVLLARLLAAELRQIRQREAAHLQSQRMEALGRLTGGVAHDFNNLLTPIVGGLDLIRRRATDERVLRYVDAAAISAERAKALVSRLLSFSRRQSLVPEAIDLSGLLDSMADLLARSLTPAIDLKLDVAPQVCPALADRGQLELAILNLVINSRDAMPEGGVIRLSVAMAAASATAALPPGAYLAIAVADTGTGMDAATMRQAIDPFFTTKPAERGTGLGLSMVHGFAAQSGGALQLASTPGEGTTATILLPCSAEADRTVRHVPDHPTLPPGRILLVDDEEGVRQAVAAMLADAGQAVVEAASVDEALALLQRGAAFDLIVTDYVMPIRSGDELIRAVGAAWPTLPILLVTGYVTAGRELPGDVPILMKPFGRDELVEAVSKLRRGEASPRHRPSG